MDNIDKNPKVVDKADTIRKVENLFDDYYKLSGYEATHPLYRTLRLTLFQIGEVLLRAEVITENSLSKLDGLLQFSHPG